MATQITTTKSRYLSEEDAIILDTINLDDAITVEPNDDQCLGNRINTVATPIFQEALPTVKENSFSTPTIERNYTKKPAYPGIKAVFVMDSEKSKITMNSIGERKLEFSTPTEGAMIKKVIFLEMEKGNVQISVKLNPKKGVLVRPYLKACFPQFPYKHPSLSGNTPEQRLEIFQWVKENNSFSEDILPVIESLIEQGNWNNFKPSDLEFIEETWVSNSEEFKK